MPMTGFNCHRHFLPRHLLVAPKCLQKPVLEMIDNEIAMVKSGQEGYIGIKINSLTDKKIIAKLIEASEAGVKIDMVIRGICCLRSGIEDLTDNIRIINIVGRFLEHSRIYIFRTEARARIYNVKAREQQPDGTYVCLTPEENAPLNSQEYFFDAAYAAAENNNFR